jgi:Flp pilus assembly protein TadB
MAEPRGTGLQTIFGFFLGLMVTSFIGVGVYTFYPPPDRPYRDQIVNLERQQQEVKASKPATDLTDSERDRIQALQREINAAQDQSRIASERWGRRTSIILIALATLAMVVSLVRAVQLPVIANGLLLGGVFTMIYGVGWIIATDSSTLRFFVMTAALAITLALGYVRFVRQRDVMPASYPASASVHGAAGDLEQRVRALEEKFSKMADVIGGPK